jgi:hypothetical protein
MRGKGFADSLPSEDRQTFITMLNDCHKYSKAINAKGRPFPTEPVIMALLFSQHKLIEWLEFTNFQTQTSRSETTVKAGFNRERFRD